MKLHKVVKTKRVEVRILMHGNLLLMVISFKTLFTKKFRQGRLQVFLLWIKYVAGVKNLF